MSELLSPSRRARFGGKVHPRLIETWVDPFDPDIVYAKDTRDGYTWARSRENWAAIAVQAIRDPATSSEYTVAVAKVVMGKDGWAEAERIVRAVDEAARISGIDDEMRQAMM